MATSQRNISQPLLAQLLQAPDKRSQHLKTQQDQQIATLEVGPNMMHAFVAIVWPGLNDCQELGLSLPELHRRNIEATSLSFSYTTRKKVKRKKNSREGELCRYNFFTCTCFFRTLAWLEIYFFILLFTVLSSGNMKVFCL